MPSLSPLSSLAKNWIPIGAIFHFVAAVEERRMVNYNNDNNNNNNNNNNNSNNNNIIIIILIDFSCRSTVRACMTLSKTQASMNPFAIGHLPRANIQINNSVFLKKGNQTWQQLYFHFVAVVQEHGNFLNRNEKRLQLSACSLSTKKFGDAE